MDKFKLEVNEQAWNGEEKDAQLSNLQGMRTYTSGVARMQQHVAALDRYDDFRELKIDTEAYKRKSDGESGEYGIPEDDHIHKINPATKKRDVILPHQRNAAKRFLSELRGFGLLADVVGSGKTFEAGVVLSELAARGNMNSLLIIAPGQVIDSWVDVLENKFGMGKNTLYQVRTEGYEDVIGEDMELPNELSLNVSINRANGRPIIVDVTIFAQWTMNDAADFDAIVVDEAHHLSEEEGEFAKAMKLLSEMINARKRQFKTTYCLLLSATPHSGNLEKMFRLWYFIRFQGGEASDFEEKSDSERTEEYHKEKDYYKNIICTGATNVRDFIRREKLNEFRPGQPLRKLLDKWMGESGKMDFDNSSEYAKSIIIDEFLDTDTKYDARTTVKQEAHRRVASAYHNRVLRSIMIRQPNNSVNQRKWIRSVLYYPMLKPKLKFKVENGEDTLALDYTSLNDFNMPKVTVLCRDGSPNENYTSKTYYLNNYIAEKAVRADNMGKKAYEMYSDIINKILAQLKEVSSKENIFTKEEAMNSFYQAVVNKLNDKWNTVAIVPIKYDKSKLGYKYEYLTKLLRSERGSRRVVVFFDYDLPRTEMAFEAVRDALLESEFKDRLLISSDGTRAKVIEKFNNKEDAILLVNNADFTEGANLQLSNVIVNYQVTPDPLAMDQRIGRIFRLGQKNDVYIPSLANINELEGFALGYFSGIGLMASNSGDATILAGSNSDNMVALRCPVCGEKSISIVPKAEYEEWKRRNDDNLICRHLDQPNCSVGPMMKTEITVMDFKCDKCGHSITRINSGGSVENNEGYQCSSFNDYGDRGKLCQDIDSKSNENNRQIYCSKLCSMKHCRKFKTAALKGCPVLAAVKSNPNMDDSLLQSICENCELRDNKCAPSCYYSSTADGINDCRKCNWSMCTPKPFKLDFDENWEAKCPNCKNGKLKPVVPSTFALFIKELWKFENDGGINFCKNLEKEMDSVAEIREILSLDNEVKR